ncbi:MAG: hypothetical protein OEX22_00030 [Cyclobacteriaceae bacterium]|nr:hypothetical protein [Cyclobacteriaceae bacterium]
MKSLISILTISLLLVGTSVNGQSYTFKVLANKGANEVKVGNEWKPLKTGASLKDGEELKLSENAYLGLVHNSGKTLELKESGTHKISDLAAKISTGGSNVANKYADFVLSKMSADKKTGRLSATGAVHRAVVNSSINVYVPNSVDVYNSQALIEWGNVEGENVFIVNVVNMFGDELLSVESSTNKYLLDLTSDKIKNEAALLVTVSVKGNEEMKSEEVAIKRLPNDKMEMVKANLGELMSEVDTQNALNNYILAGFYEESRLLLDALYYYEEAIKIAPEVESYQEAYEEFLFRNGLN